MAPVSLFNKTSNTKMRKQKFKKKGTVLFTFIKQ